MSDPLEEIRASFFVECEELLESLNDALQEIDSGSRDPEVINTAFRAVHSIKGGAGAFGLDQLVSFSHAFETAMDQVRNGDLVPDPEMIALFFRCGDTLSDLVRAARAGSNLPESALQDILAGLDGLAGTDPGAAGDAEAEAAFQPVTLALDLNLEEASDLPEPDRPDVMPQRDLTIRFAPEPELYHSGNEPLFLLRALAELGTVRTQCEIAALPDLAAYDANTSVLSWTVHLSTAAEDSTIEEIFEFVEGLCTLTIEAAEEETGDTIAMITEDMTAAPPSDAGSPPPDIPETDEAAATPPPAQPGATVRVDLERIDRLVNLVGELVINQAMLSQSVSASSLSANSKIASGLDEFQQLTRDIQDSVMMIRAQPVKSLFQRMARIVREASASVGKSVRLQTEGEATEIDKTVIERLADPLTHIIRNAVDHGLESPEARRAAGKIEQGIVKLSAAHRSGRVVIEIADDGGGIDRHKVQSIAENKGLIPGGQTLSDAEIDNLLFLPGFSTADAVSNLSGRGVGMDVVRTAIAALGGRISIASTRGAGTTITISLPLTLAVLDGMVIQVRDETLVVPLNAISETLSLNDGDARAVGPRTHVVRVRDSFVPLIDLGAELGYGEPHADYVGAIVLLIAEEDGSRAALVVDGIEDQRQVVIKGLQDSYGHVPGIAAATILGDGQVALILDPADLLANATGLTRPPTALTATG